MTSKEALKIIRSYHDEMIYHSDCAFIEIENIFKQELDIIEKDLEVLEILENKSVDIHLIKDIMKDDRKFECYPDENLTQEEFNIIKEWLEK